MTSRDRHGATPPRVPAFLLRLLPRQHRDHLVGDLSEQFGARVSHGALSARLWFWRALSWSIAANLVTRLRYRLREGVWSASSGTGRVPGPRLHPIAGLAKDARFAVRSLLKTPGLVLGAVVMLALGIGANTAMFGMNAGMLRIVQRFEDPDELVFLWNVMPGQQIAGVSMPDYLAWRAQSDAFEDMGVYRQLAKYVTGDGEPLRISAVEISANAMPLLGLDTRIGRLHGPADEAASAPPVAVISHRFWRERYAEATDVVGQIVRLNDVPFTIVGVLPAEAEFEIMWRDVAVFTPLVLNPTDLTREDRVYRVVARLADGTSVEHAQAQMTAIAARLAERRPATNAEVRARVQPFADRFYSFDDRLAMGSLVAAVLAVLLIACVNLANVFLARGSTRQGEVAVRLALGASRGRVVRQLLVESLLLSVLGGALGVAAGLWGLQLLLASLPSAPILPHEVGPDLAVLAHAVALVTASALAFGLAPALLASRGPLIDAIKTSGTSTSASRGRMKFRNGILVGQLALTVPLALSCVVGFRQVQTLASLDFGFATDQLLIAQLDLPTHRFTDPARRAELYGAMVETVRALPGVEKAAAGMNVPIGAYQASVWAPLVAEGLEAEEGSSRGPMGYEVVTPEYFDTLGVPLRQGRALTAADRPGAPVVAVVNESMAERYWPDENPVGRRLVPVTTEGRWDPDTAPREITIVGVVADFGATFYGDPPSPALYLSSFQQPPDSMKLVVRTRTDPSSLATALREAVGRVDSGVPVSSMTTGEGLVDLWLQESRTIAAVLGVLGVLALGMAMIGLYGMVAYSVAQRTFELGLRMVLGADRGAIRRTVMRSYLVLAAVGVAAGLLISAIGGFVVRSQLVMLRIPIVSTVSGLVLLLAVVVLVASYLPARRATRIEPIRALRFE